MGSELYVSPIALSSFCSVRLRLPCSGSLGPRFPTFSVCSAAADSRYYAPLRLPEAHLARSVRHFAWRYLAFSSWFCASRLTRLAARRGSLRPAPGLFSTADLVPVTCKETTGSPKFPCYPLVTCPALGPRWCFRYSPSRVASCCLPSRVTGSAFPPLRWLSLMDHNLLHFGALSHGLLPHYTRLRTHHY
jgi:hypothetical protein